MINDQYNYSILSESIISPSLESFKRMVHAKAEEKGEILKIGTNSQEWHVHKSPSYLARNIPRSSGGLAGRQYWKK